MALTAGTRVGPYEVRSSLGEGGMGVVFRAHDTKLQRDVALKLLPDHFATDGDRLLRFQREAQLLASLNHPNIAQIYGLEESGALRCIVMELVDGETLQERLRRGPIPIDEALRIAKQIAEAVEAAHERGVVHRDLKPANIKLAPDGKVKVLDFGLAKTFHEPQQMSVSNSPTLMGASMPGVIVGTAAYMSPEQARAKTVDRRTDVWAFGCVLYEILTAKPAFTGETVTEILARILEREPDFDLLRDNIPPRVREICRRCLEKDLRRRFQDIGDVRYEIEAVLAGGKPSDIAAPPASGARPARLHRVWTALLAFIALTLAIPATLYFRGTPNETPETRLDVTTPPTSDPISFAISPDGRNLVFVATSDGVSRLWLRSLDSTTPQAIAGTEGATYPFWSPDSRSVGYFADGKLKRIDAHGGTAQDLAPAASGRGGAWNKDGVIVFAPTGAGALYRISANGGEAMPVTEIEGARQNNHRMPQFLSDGRHFLFFAQGNERGIYVGSLDSTQSRRLLEAEAAAVYIPPGNIVFIRQGTLFAQRFDDQKHEPVGDAFTVAQQVAFDPTLSIGALSAARGVLVYRTGAAFGKRQLTWFDRSGKNLGMLGDPDIPGLNPELSPDGKNVALDRIVDGNPDIWLLEIARNVFTRVTFEERSDELAPIWSPDGNRVVFAARRKGVHDLYEKQIGASMDAPHWESQVIKWPMAWSPDGQFLLYREQNPKTNFDLWALAVMGDRKPTPIATTGFEEREAQFSPDGRWISYQSNESGNFEIYIQPFPGPGTKSRISTNGGAQARWRRDGKALFYIALDGKLTEVPITLSSNGQTVDVGKPTALFPTHLALGPVPAIQRHQYIVSLDGQRFLMNVTTEQQFTTPITLILNWNGLR